MGQRIRTDSRGCIDPSTEQHHNFTQNVSTSPLNAYSGLNENSNLNV